MKDGELHEAFDFTIELARRCGAIVKTAFSLPKEIDLKSSAVDLVTKTDQEVEKTIIGAIKSKYPSHRIIGEESTAAGIPVILTDEPTWVIDPVDGTTNFVCGFPYTAVCIGVMINKMPVIGVVYNPIMDQMFSAKKDGGATMNGKTLKVSDTKEMEQSLILSEFGSSRDEKMQKAVIDNMYNVVMAPVRGIRGLGSAACNICAVASGQADAYFETGMHIWDICAAGLILQEAGGVNISTDGSELNYLNRKFIGACTMPLAQKIASKLVQINVTPDGSIQTTDTLLATWQDFEIYFFCFVKTALQLVVSVLV